MALATQCPHCHTTFRVAQDQLKLRAGLVRCGNCKQIFNGVEHLLPPEGEQRAPDAAPVPASSTEEVQVTPESASSPSAISARSEPESPLAAVPAGPPPSTQDPLQRITLIDIAAHPTAPAKPASSPEEDVDATDPLAQTIDELRRKPLRGSKPPSPEAEEDPADQIDTEGDDEEPGFVRQGRRKQQLGRVMRIIMGVGSVVLLLVLVLQSAYVFRDQIAVRLPATKPLLAQLCVTLGCQVGLPTQIDAVSLESSELQALASEKNAFMFNALLRNRDATARAWPAIELTLNDAGEQPVARRVFTARDYLGNAQEIANGFAGNSERQIKLYLSLSQLKAAGYRVYLFYP